MSNATTKFSRSNTALVTPFTADGKLDEQGFADFCEWQIAEGIHGLVPMGTTGESATVSQAEHERVVEIAVEVSKGRVPVIAGAGSNNTIEAVEYAKHAEKVGADAALVVIPYYNKPNARGLKQHFKEVAEATSLPIFIYNVPGRTIIDMDPQTMGEIAAAHDNVIGVKDASGDVARASLQRQTCGHDFVQLTGEDGSALGHRAHGGVGIISVTSNVAPALCSQFQQALADDDFDTARELQDRLMPLHTAMFAEPSPGGPKYALSLLGKMENNLRSPMVPVSEPVQEQIRAAMVHAGLIN